MNEIIEQEPAGMFDELHAELIRLGLGNTGRLPVTHVKGEAMDEVFICDMCESTENVQSPIWEECCAYCALSMHEANIEVIKRAIAKAEEQS